MTSSPKDLPELDIEREKLRLEKAIADLRASGLVELTWLPGQSWYDLQRAMRRGPWHIFHFIGHGGFDARTDEGLIALENEERKAYLLSATQMALLLADHRSLRLVVLNSCEGAKGSELDIFSGTASILVRRGMGKGFRQCWPCNMRLPIGQALNYRAHSMTHWLMDHL